MEVVHLRLPALLLRRIDAIAQERGQARSEVIRALVAQSLDVEGIGIVVGSFVGERVEASVVSAVREAMVDLLSRKQIASLGVALSFAILKSQARPNDEIAPILKSVRAALLASGEGD